MPPRTLVPASALTATDSQVTEVRAIFARANPAAVPSRSDVRHRIEDQLFFAAFFGRRVRYEDPRPGKRRGSGVEVPDSGT